MHYICTFDMARAAGIPDVAANTIAYASQLVDDSTRYCSEAHRDGGLLFGITTAHTLLEALARSTSDRVTKLEDQRKVWVPFHFFPGGAGDTFYEKIICVMDGELVNERRIQLASATPSRLNEKARWYSTLASPSNQRLRGVWAMHTLPGKNGTTSARQ